MLYFSIWSSFFKTVFPSRNNILHIFSGDIFQPFSHCAFHFLIAWKLCSSQKSLRRPNKWKGGGGSYFQSKSLIVSNDFAAAFNLVFWVQNIEIPKTTDLRKGKVLMLKFVCLIHKNYQLFRSVFIIALSAKMSALTETTINPIFPSIYMNIITLILVSSE